MAFTEGRKASTLALLAQAKQSITDAETEINDTVVNPLLVIGKLRVAADQLAGAAAEAGTALD